MSKEELIYRLKKQTGISANQKRFHRVKSILFDRNNTTYSLQETDKSCIYLTRYYDGLRNIKIVVEFGENELCVYYPDIIYNFVGVGV